MNAFLTPENRLREQLIAAYSLADDAAAMATMSDRAIAAGQHEIAAELINMSARLGARAKHAAWHVEETLNTPASVSKHEGV